MNDLTQVLADHPVAEGWNPCVATSAPLVFSTSTNNSSYSGNLERLRDLW